MEISLPMLRILTTFLGAGANIFPNFGMPGTQIDLQYLNHDKANYMAYAEDPLVCHEPMKLRFSAEAGKNILSLQDNAQNLKVPCLIMCGSEDMLVPPKSVKNFYENVQIEDKTFIEYEGFYHEIFNEGDNRRVYAGVDSWFLPRI